jgi:hypothetical protein
MGSPFENVRESAEALAQNASVAARAASAARSDLGSWYLMRGEPARAATSAESR